LLRRAPKRWFQRDASSNSIDGRMSKLEISLMRLFELHRGLLIPAPDVSKAIGPIEVAILDLAFQQRVFCWEVRQ